MFKNDSTSSVIENLNKFMLSKDFFELNKSSYKTDNKQISKPPKETQDQHYHDIDTLFCCFYTIFNKSIHEQPKNKVQEQQIKISIAENLDSYKDLIKECKLITMTNLKDNLVNDSRITLTSFFTLCYINNFNVIWVYSKVGHKMQRNDSTDFFFVKQNKSLYTLVENYNELMNDVFWIDSVKKPLKSIASYKVEEIKDILKVVCSNNLSSVKKNKKEYYDDLVQYFLSLSLEI